MTTPAFAQSEEPFMLDELVIQSRAAQELLGNTEITEEEIEGLNPRTMRDVFAGESSVTTGGGASIAQKVLVNGIEESLLSVTIDGARQNKSAFHHTGNVLIDPALLKRVEISEGIAPADAGAGALAGAIAYETKDARDFLLGGQSFGGSVRASYGTDDSKRGTLILAGQSMGFEWLLSGTRHTSDDYEDGDGETVPGTAADLTDYIGKTAYTTQAGHRFELSASQTEDTGLRQSQAGFIRPDFAAVVGRDAVLYEALSKRQSYTFSYTDEQPEGWFAPSVQLTYNTQEIDAGTAAWGENTSLSGVAKNEWRLSNGTLTAGVDFFDEDAEGEQYNEDGSIATSGEESMLDIGAFVQVRQDLTSRISASYGARVDWQEFEAADGQEFDDTGVSGNGSIDVALTDALHINAGVASSWGGYELGEAAIINFRTPWLYDGFTTSRANSGRIGLRYEQMGWTASAALFRTEVEDINAVLPEEGARGATNDVTSSGFELALGYAGERGFAQISYTNADVELDSDVITTTSYYLGRPVGEIIAMEAGYALTPEWRLGGSAEIALENDDTDPSLDSYEVLNAFAAYTPQAYDGLEVRLDVRNIFDETYVSRGSDGINFEGVVPLNEPGRNVQLTAGMQF
ncbi:TonB-dependent receptor domain-containing protein [Paracoccaceae bacterium GXU_MW_L88]